MSGKKPMNLEDAEKVFLEVFEILDKFQIKLFLSDGTMLGAIRDKGIIPWDYDIDTRIAISDWDFSVFEEFERNGFQCNKGMLPKLYQDLPVAVDIIKRGIDFGIGFNYYYPPEDVVVFLAGKPSSPGTVQPARFYRGEHFTNFLNIKVRIPYPSIEYVERIYGPGWRIPSKSRHSRTPCKSISIKKYVEYFHKHPEVNKRK